MRLAMTFALLASPALADVPSAVNDYLLPGVARFAETAAELDAAAQADCSPDAIIPAYHAAFDAWLAIGDFKFGPTETAALSISFWPDTRGFTPKTLNRLIADQDTIVENAADFSEISIAVRGFYPLERLLFDEAFNGYDIDSYSCTLTRAITRDLSGQAARLASDWNDAFAAALLTAGDAENSTYFSEEEAQRAIYTQVLASLEFTKDTRIGRPLGEPTRPRPTRADAWRASRPVTNILLAATASVKLAEALADWELPATRAALKAAQETADGISDKSLQDIDDLMKRFQLEVLQQNIDAIYQAIAVEVGARYGIAPGFNSSDGD